MFGKEVFTKCLSLLTITERYMNALDYTFDAQKENLGTTGNDTSPPRQSCLPTCMKNGSWRQHRLSQHLVPQ